MKKYTSRTIEDTAKVAKEWLGNIVESVVSDTTTNKSAYVVGLSGHLGAGKTAFVKCIAKELGIKDEVTSPTYVIMKIYDIDQKVAEKNLGVKVPWKKLVHVDAYRLERREELEAITFDKLVSDPSNLVMVEWPENVAIKNDYSNITFKILDAEEGRSIEII